MSVASVKGASYYVTFIDDFSSKTWIYFMKTKDEVFSHFREFKAQVENMTGRKIKVPRIDNGVSTPPISSLISRRHGSEGEDCGLQPAVEWGCREEEQVYRQCDEGHDP
jgi:hypothetical protein